MFFFFFPPLKIYADTNTTPLVFFSRPSKKDLHLWRGFSSLNIFLCWSTLILRFYFFFFSSLASLISSMTKTKKHERGHLRERSLLSYLIFPFLFLFYLFHHLLRSFLPLCMYIDTHEYTCKLV